MSFLKWRFEPFHEFLTGISDGLGGIKALPSDNYPPLASLLKPHLDGSIETFPAGEAVLGLLDSRGFRQTAFAPLTGGVVTRRGNNNL